MFCVTFCMIVEWLRWNLIKHLSSPLRFISVNSYRGFPGGNGSVPPCTEIQQSLLWQPRYWSAGIKDAVPGEECLQGRGCEPQFCTRLSCIAGCPHEQGLSRSGLCCEMLFILQVGCAGTAVSTAGKGLSAHLFDRMVLLCFCRVISILQFAVF